MVQTAGRQTRDPHILLIEDLKPGTDCRTRLQPSNGQPLDLIILTQTQARQLWKTQLCGQERILLCANNLSIHDDEVRIEIPLPGRLELSVFPPLAGLKSSTGQPLTAQPDGIFTRYTLDLQPPDNPAIQARLTQPAGAARDVPIGPLGVAQAPGDGDFQNAAVWQIDISEAAWSLCDDPRVQEVFLRIRYTGDVARLYAGEQLLDDQFYDGQPWEIGLRRFHQSARGQALTLRVLPLRKDAPIYLPPEQWPDFGGRDAVAQLTSIDLTVVGNAALIAGE